ncbi:MAG: hypothetical protein K2K93_12165 [Muribaculaceae bacterium]|nr:hypothetical protein [Muribaculaceae bacterium]
MKRILLVFALILPALMSQAVSINGLFKKYKKFPEAKYVNMNKKDMRAMLDSVTSEVDKEVYRTGNGMQMLLMHLEDEAQIEQLTSEINSLKDYSLALSFTHNNGKQTLNTTIEGISSDKAKEAANAFIASFIDPTMSVDVYCKETSGEDLIKPLYLLNFWGFTGLVYLDGKIKASDADKILTFTSDTDATVKVERVLPSEESESSD